MPIKMSRVFVDVGKLILKFICEPKQLEYLTQFWKRIRKYPSTWFSDLIYTYSCQDRKWQRDTHIDQGDRIDNSEIDSVHRDGQLTFFTKMQRQFKGERIFFSINDAGTIKHV